MAGLKLKPFDWVALAVSVAAFAGFLFVGRLTAQSSGYVTIQTQEGEWMYDLDRDREMTFKGPIGESVILIKDGKVSFEHSDCEDHLCERMGELSRGGDWSACLPNRVFLSITGNEGEVDYATK